MKGLAFNRAAVVGRELDYMREAALAGHLSGDGAFTRKCHEWLGQRLGGATVLLTTSCTHALEMAALLLDIAPGDEVIVPSFTFVSTANAFALRGARLVFGDVRPDTLNLDETRLEHLITSSTRAIVVVHYAGVACNMDVILGIAARHGVPVVEDNAHGLFGRYKGRPLGALGDIATLSFHETKNVTCGEGGAIVLNNPAFVDRAEIIREKGTERSRFFRGEVDKYTWVDLGSSYLPSELLSAFLFGQFEMVETIQAHRRRLWARYAEALTPWARSTGTALATVPADCEHPGHMFWMLMPSMERREDFITRLRSAGIHAVSHYLPLHLSAVGQRVAARPADCPVSEDVARRLVRLPLFVGLSDAEQDRVIGEVLEIA